MEQKSQNTTKNKDLDQRSTVELESRLTWVAPVGINIEIKLWKDMHEHMTSCIHSVFWGGISSPFLATISAKGVSNSICCGSSKLISDPMVGIRFLYCTLHSCLRYPQATTQLHWGYQLLSTGVLHTLWALTVMPQPYSMEGALLSIVPRNFHLLSICSTGDSCHIVAARAVRWQGQATAVQNPESPMQPPLAANWKTYPPSQ